MPRDEEPVGSSFYAPAPRLRPTDRFALRRMSWLSSPNASINLARMHASKEAHSVGPNLWRSKAIGAVARTIHAHACRVVIAGSVCANSCTSTSSNPAAVIS